MSKGAEAQQYDVAIPGTVDGVFDVVCQAVRAGHYSRAKEQPFTKMVTFNSGNGLIGAYRWMAQVASGPDGQPHVRVTLAPVRQTNNRLEVGYMAKLANKFYTSVGQLAASAA